MATLFTSELLCVNFSGKCGSIPRSFLVLTISMDGLCAPGSSHFQGSRVVRIWKKILPRLYTSDFSVISVLLRNSSGDRHYPPLFEQKPKNGRNGQFQLFISQAHQSQVFGNYLRTVKNILKTTHFT